MPAGGIAAYAGERGLKYEADQQVRARTPTLHACSGELHEAATGRLGEGLEGTLCHVELDRDTDGGGGPSAPKAGAFKRTAVVTRVPESIAFLPLLNCRDRSAPRVVGDQFVYEDVETESVELARRYQLQVAKGQDPGWQRELFSPAFIAWLNRAPGGFAFEVLEGNVVISADGHLRSKEELDQFCELASAVAQRLRGESLEEIGQAGEDSYAASSVGWDMRKVEAELAKVPFASPPASVPTAVEAFQPRAGRKPRVVLAALVRALIAAAVAAALGFVILGGIAGAAAAGAAIFFIAFLLARRMKAYPWAARCGLEAFMREYARARQLRLENARRFQAEHLELDLPGNMQFAMSGELPGGLDGTLAVVQDAGDTRKVVTMFGERPATDMYGEALAYEVVITRATDGKLLTEPGPIAGDEKNPLYLAREGSTVAVMRPIVGNLVITSAELDQLSKRVSTLLN